MRLAITCSYSLCFGIFATGCIFPPFDVEGKTCTQQEPCPGDLICVPTASGEGICRRTPGTNPGNNACTGRPDDAGFVDLPGTVGRFDWLAVDGGYLAIYEDDPDPAGNGSGHVYLQGFNNDLQPVTNPVDVLGASLTNVAERPRLLATDAGVYAAWIELDGLTEMSNIVVSPLGLHGAWVTQNDGGAAPRYVVSVARSVSAELALLATTSNLVVGWADATTLRVQAVSVSFDGTRGSLKTLGVSNQGVSTMDLTWLGDAGFFAAWDEDRGVRWQQLDEQLVPQSSGGLVGTFGSVSHITTRNFGGGDPLLVFEGENVPQVVWPLTNSSPQALPIAFSGFDVLRVLELGPGRFLLAGSGQNELWGVTVSPNRALSPKFPLVNANRAAYDVVLARRGQAVAVAAKFEKAVGILPNFAGNVVCLP